MSKTDSNLPLAPLDLEIEALRMLKWVSTTALQCCVMTIYHGGVHVHDNLSKDCMDEVDCIDLFIIRSQM